MKVSIKKSNYFYSEDEVYLLITFRKKTRKILLLSLDIWREPKWYSGIFNAFLQGLIDGTIIVFLINFLIYQPIIGIGICLGILLFRRK